MCVGEGSSRFLCVTSLGSPGVAPSAGIKGALTPPCPASLFCLILVFLPTPPCFIFVFVLFYLSRQPPNVLDLGCRPGWPLPLSPGVQVCTYHSWLLSPLSKQSSEIRDLRM